MSVTDPRSINYSTLGLPSVANGSGISPRPILRAEIHVISGLIPDPSPIVTLCTRDSKQWIRDQCTAQANMPLRDDQSLLTLIPEHKLQYFRLPTRVSYAQGSVLVVSGFAIITVLPQPESVPLFQNLSTVPE